MSLPADYADRVYAGVLGKTIGVYLGRPFEGWSHKDIEAEFGEITGYVHERMKAPLVVTDDDLSGTFTFLRALEDSGYDRGIDPARIGETWLNYLIEGRTVLWWGGMGVSTEHTAYLRLKAGIPAPASGSAKLNGRVVAEQIGAQIFIDGWGMVAPGDPDLAADLAGRAASVSHDGEAVHGAKVIAAMEAAAFGEADVNRLLDAGVARIPADSLIARLIADLRSWHRADGDWRVTRKRLDEAYGYATYGGGCHMIPNHGVIVLALLYGGGDFDRSLMIANTSGWDTDCNSGNVGCLLGLRNGLAGIGPKWRDPVADRLLLPTADGGRTVTDAAREALAVVNAGRALAGEPALAPKDGARFHFTFPGSVQGWRADGPGTSVAQDPAGGAALVLRWEDAGPDRPARAWTPTFIPPESLAMPGYGLFASPTVYPGQEVRARVAAETGNAGPVRVELELLAYGEGDAPVRKPGTAATLAPGEAKNLLWRVPSTGGAPIYGIGLSAAPEKAGAGVVRLDRLGWSGAPDVDLGRPAAKVGRWVDAWVNGVSAIHADWGGQFRLVQNDGRGLALTGTREWTDYEASAVLVPHLTSAFGLGARVQGMRRYYALIVSVDGAARLVRRVADEEKVLSQGPFPLVLDAPHEFYLTVRGERLSAQVASNGRKWMVECRDKSPVLANGGVALVVDDGAVDVRSVHVKPAF